MRLLSGLLEALHRSRQAQAAAVIRRYSHLLDGVQFAEHDWSRPVQRVGRTLPLDASAASRVEAVRADAVALMPAFRRRAVP